MSLLISIFSKKCWYIDNRYIVSIYCIDISYRYIYCTPLEGGEVTQSLKPLLSQNSHWKLQLNLNCRNGEQLNRKGWFSIWPCRHLSLSCHLSRRQFLNQEMRVQCWEEICIGFLAQSVIGSTFSLSSPWEDNCLTLLLWRQI